jgi:peptidoglycan/xylan/chitin deacetylase (PgdA/CDA1 family)
MQPGMVVDPDTFRKQLQWLKQSFCIVDLSAWLRGNNGFSDTVCAITFDDGWQDTYEFAFPILKEECAPATVFLVADMIGRNQSFWPERLARAIWNGGHGLNTYALSRAELSWLDELGVFELVKDGAPNRRQLDEIISKAKKYPDSEVKEKTELLEALLGIGKSPDVPDLLDWEQVQKMVASGLVAVGSHTLRHTRLTDAVDQVILEKEIIGSKNLIKDHLKCDVDVFCYPDGAMTSQAEQIVQRHYLGACTTTKGWNSIRTDPYRLKRIGVHQDVAFDETSFLARLSAWI